MKKLLFTSLLAAAVMLGATTTFDDAPAPTKKVTEKAKTKGKKTGKKGAEKEKGKKPSGGSTTPAPK